MSRKNRKTVAPAPVSSDVSSDVPPAVAAVLESAIVAALAPAPADIPLPAAPVDLMPDATVHAVALTPPPIRTRRTVASLAAHDNPAAPPTRTISLGERFAACHIDAAPFIFGDGFLNVTPPCVNFDAPVLDAHAPGYVSVPVTPVRRPAALRLALRLLNYASDPTTIPADLLRCVIVAYAHDRALRSTRTRPVGYFDGNGISSLDLRASLARAAARLAFLPPVGLGTNAACNVTIPDLRANVAARVAALDATTT